MILDERTEFADAVAVSGAAATRLVGDVLDLQTPGRDVGTGEEIFAVVSVEVAPAGADTVEFIIASDAAAAIATDGTATQHYTTGAVAIASLPAGKTFAFALPPEGHVYERFVGLLVKNVGAGALTALVVNAYLTKDVTRWKSYANAVGA